MKNLSQHDLSKLTGVTRSMIGSYELEQFYPTLDSINKLGKVLDVDFLCKDGYSHFLINSAYFKDKLIDWRLENHLTKRNAAKLLDISERGYSLWEDGVIMGVKTYYKVEGNLIRYKLI